VMPAKGGDCVAVLMGIGTTRMCGGRRTGSCWHLFRIGMETLNCDQNMAEGAQQHLEQRTALSRTDGAIRVSAQGPKGNAAAARISITDGQGRFYAPLSLDSCR